MMTDPTDDLAIVLFSDDDEDVDGAAYRLADRVAIDDAAHWLADLAGDDACDACERYGDGACVALGCEPCQ